MRSKEQKRQQRIKRTEKHSQRQIVKKVLSLFLLGRKEEIDLVEVI